MEKLVVFDYNDSTVCIWDVKPGTYIDEEYIENLGYHLSEISWMHCVDGMAIHYHKRVLE